MVAIEAGKIRQSHTHGALRPVEKEGKADSKDLEGKERSIPHKAEEVTQYSALLAGGGGMTRGKEMELCNKAPLLGIFRKLKAALNDKSLGIHHRG
jgi:hypothetical protein